MQNRLFPMLGVASLVFAATAAAADRSGSSGAAESGTPLSTILITADADRPAALADPPATLGVITAEQIGESINAVTTPSVLQYLPSIHVRERYIGDTNSVLVMRVNSSVSSAQTAVYADDLLLSNFLNNSYSTAPRWNLVSPEEISRVDVLYGPFSALYPGNSAAGVVLMSTRMPQKFEAHLKLDEFGERYRLYGTDDRFNGGHAVASVGDRIRGFSFWAGIDHLDNHGHPMTFTAATAKSGAAAANGLYTTIASGAYADIDTSGAARITVGSASIDHTVQDNLKIKLAYDLTPTVRIAYTVGLWHNESNKTGDSYLRDAGGNTIYGTGGTGAYSFLRINGVDYTAAAPSSSNTVQDHWLHGLSLRTSTGGAWDWDAVLSYFSMRKDLALTSSGNFGATASNGPSIVGGTITDASGTGWKSLDLRGEWRPEGNLNSAHHLSFGYHIDSYVTHSDTFNVATGTDWRGNVPGTLNSNSRGQTQTQALYLQDSWRWSPIWKLLAGVRVEHWTATNGSNYASGSGVAYADRSVNGLSPKLSVSWQPAQYWSLRSSFGRGVRFPTVGELFTNVGIKTTSGANPTAAQQAAFPAPYNSAKTNDPNLRPESVNSADLTAEKSFGWGLLRTSAFFEFKQDALISQSDFTTLPGYAISSIQNVDRVRTEGVEAALEAADVVVRGLGVTASVTYAHSKITADSKNPGLEGSDQPRIPGWRATLLTVYHLNPQWSFSVAGRYSGHQHNALFNTSTRQYNDINPDVYGAVSHYEVMDVKANWCVTKRFSASLGVNNLNNFDYFVNPNPYPQRTLFLSLKADL